MCDKRKDYNLVRSRLWS